MGSKQSCRVLQTIPRALAVRNSRLAVSRRPRRNCDELVQAGFIAAADTADELTESGQQAYARIFAARQDLIERLLDGWHPQLHPRLLELVTEITHELAASSERPDPDLDPVR